MCVDLVTPPSTSIHTHNTQAQKLGMLVFHLEAALRFSFPCSDHRFSLSGYPKHSLVGRPISDLHLPPHTVQFTPFLINVSAMHNLPRSNHITLKLGPTPSPTPATPRPVQDRSLYLPVGTTCIHSLCLECKSDVILCHRTNSC